MEGNKTRLQVEDGVGIVTMCSAGNLNAVDVEMARELLDLLDRCERDEEVKVVVVRGEGKAFSAGGDIGFLYGRLERQEPRSDELVVLVGQLALAVKRMDKLVITAVAGAAAGAGANLALSGDFVLCAENARFIQAFVGIALVPDTGGPYLLSRSIGAQRALEMCITGRPVGAQEARELGLVHQIFPAGELEAGTMELARRLAAGPLKAYANIKKQVYGAAFRDYEWYLTQVEETTMMACAGTRDHEEGVRAFVEKRRPRFRGE